MDDDERRTPMTTPAERDPSYWYAEDGDVRSTSVLEAMRAYRAAEVAMRRRTQQSMDMGENELLVLRFLARARQRDEIVTPVHLSRYLGITSASTTALIDRLARSGHVVRMPNPVDRRSVIITSSPRAEEEIRDTLGAMHERMMAVVRPMSPSDRSVVIGFLDAMRLAVDSIDSAPGTAMDEDDPV
jgi:DNA-binding MarR family transcriptional regulator